MPAAGQPLHDARRTAATMLLVLRVRTDLTDDQKAAIRLIAEALPPYWRRRIREPLGDDGGLTSGAGRR
jgi:hypothetical protein